MNYFELINKCLVELNYKQVYAFSELVKNEHKKIKNIINVLNSELCNSANWDFLLRKKELYLPKRTLEIDNIINGKIKSIYVDGIKFNYNDDFEKFFTNSQPANTFTTFNGKLLFPMYEEDKKLEVIYYTSNFVKSEAGDEKQFFQFESDMSVIPEVFAEPVLVYGTCMRLKGNPQHVRFNYWLSMYKEALANMRSLMNVNANYTPEIKLYRF